MTDHKAVCVKCKRLYILSYLDYSRLCKDCSQCYDVNKLHIDIEHKKAIDKLDKEFNLD